MSDGAAADPSHRVALSTISVLPQSTAEGFEAAARLGYDAVEVMVSVEPASQDATALAHLSRYHEMPVCAVHAPCLLLTQLVWGPDPWVKLQRSADLAHELGADTVVVHPPFRWQRDYARGFVEGIAELEETTGLRFAVENMYPWRTSAQRGVQVYRPGWDPSEETYAHTCVDLSHCATAQSDPLEMALRLGERLHHVHLADGSGSMKDEHLLPGHGSQPCGAFLEHLTGSGFEGWVVLELNTRRMTRTQRVDALAEALAFARAHLLSGAS